MQNDPPRVQAYDYALFGPVETRPVGRIRQVIARRLTASWTSVPHVVQFDEVDITALEAVRQERAADARAAGVRLTLLAFVMKACAQALQAFPEFNASLDASGENLVLKKYCHIAFAAETPIGLLAPVVRDVDKAGLLETARAIETLAQKARAGRLALSDAEGACFTVSNLGVLGGTGFTPVINAPEVAILGVARASRKPVWIDGAFVPRRVLPLSLVYDHRVIDGAVGGRFLAFVCQRLSESGPWRDAARP
jgi:pyruvate dehydrogenase E2 component (dihydrolipoamide acetyltransferase)